MKERTRGVGLYGLSQDTSLEDKYKVYYDNVRRCQEACGHPNIQDGYCFLCNKFFEEE